MRSSLRLAAALLLTAPATTWAQDAPLPTAEEYDLRERASLAAPLFAAHEPLEITLRTDVSWIRDKRSDEEEVEGTLTYVDQGGTGVTVPVQVRARGNFRRDPSNCNFPPLRLDFPGRRVEGTVFEGQDKLKLVTPCQDRRSDFQQYVIQEYLIYRVHGLLTPASFRVRLVRITYEDPDGGYDTRTLVGFLIEDEDQMAARNRSTISDWDRLHPDAMAGDEAAQVALFQYMIGNTDFSLPMFHNTVLLRTEGGVFVPVPYDFDWSGVVNARYARPDPMLGTQDVRQRVYRGFCREGVDHAAMAARFLGLRDQLHALYEGTELLSDGERRRVLRYYDEFFDTVADQGRYERRIVRACQNAGG